MSEDSIKNDLISSFQATGIVPIDRVRVLRKIPAYENDHVAVVSDNLVNYLQKEIYLAGI